MGKTLSVGDRAPDFAVPAPDGTSTHLSELLKDKAVVLFFYPKDFSPICTAEACAFRDSYEDFKGAGAEVIGVSADSAGDHQRFTKEHRLPFRLMSDEHGTLRDLFGVPKAMFVMPGRTTYVIDRSGVVRDVFTANLQSSGHVEQALTIVRGLKA